MNASSQTLKSQALETLAGNWTKPMLAMLMVLAPSFIAVIPGVGYVVSLLISGPLTLGMTIFLLEFSKHRDADVSLVYSAFNRFLVALFAYLLMFIFVVIWSFLFFVPGIIAAISYSQTFYLLARNPDMTAIQAIDKSKEMMNGHKARYFWLSFSFIGWFLLSLLTCGIGLLWAVPYYQVTLTKFHEDLYGGSIADSIGASSASDILDA
ncbi:MAG TPA: DUF975 family protein [Cytophagaceae bacterium]|jgi:uncharacterized membrane protein|nr:DUF975 family protein [Cytophagaceae bacterium]